MTIHQARIPGRLASAAVCILLLTCCTALASVFVRWRSAHDTLRALSAVGAQTAYEADVSINGAEGRISVLGFDDGIGNLVPRVSAMLPHAAFLNPSGSMCHSSWQQGRGLFDLILFNTQVETTSVALLLRQASGRHLTPAEAYGDSPIGNLPMYSDAAPRFVAQNHDTGTTLAVCDTSGSPAGALFFYAAQLTREGWASVLPLTGTTAIFLRGQDICCIVATPSRGGNSTTITVLHKSKTIQ